MMKRGHVCHRGRPSPAYLLSHLTAAPCLCPPTAASAKKKEKNPAAGEVKHNLRSGNLRMTNFYSYSNDSVISGLT